MQNNERVLLLLQTLQENTDDETCLTTAEIRQVLEMEGHECSIRTLRTDIQSMKNCGYKIDVRESEGASTEYAWLDREWSQPELQILIDAVAAAQFIPRDRSGKLIRKLSQMAGPSHEAELRPQILVSEHVKAKNRDMISTVQVIRRAIDQDRKIRFRYLQYNTDKQQVPKHAGTPEEEYVISPYATVWNNDRYYLVGWSDRRERVVVFRIDRMMVPKQLPNKRVPPPEDFDIRDYTDKIFKMYGGPEENVTLRCSQKILDQVISRFGEGITLENVKNGKFTVTVPVCLSTTFYAWVFQYVGQMTITAPAYVREEYAGYLKQAITEGQGKEQKNVET